MRNRFRRVLSTLSVSLSLFALSCDRSKSSSASDDPLVTNFGVNLSAVTKAEGGSPDSIVAVVLLDGSVADTLRPSLSSLSDEGVLRFPIEAAEGTKIEVLYKVYKGGQVVASGRVAWNSGVPPYIPRPFLAPKFELEGLSDGEIVIRRGVPMRIVARSTASGSQVLRIVRMDWNGDGVAEDSVKTPQGIDTLQHAWMDPGVFHPSIQVFDDVGLSRPDTFTVRVVASATVALSPDTTVSIGDSVDLRVSLDLDDSAQRQGTRLVWIGTAPVPETTSVVASRRLAWATSGLHPLTVQAIDEAGLASTANARIEVVDDPPSIDLSRFPSLVDPGSVVLLPIATSQRFGTIAAWGIDFDGDTATGWDSTGTGAPSHVEHLFPASGAFPIAVFVVDDDGNRTVGVREVLVSSSTMSMVVRRTSPTDTLLSTGDSSELRLARNFPPGVEALSTLQIRIDGGVVSEGPVALSRHFGWAAPGSHEVAWRVVMPAGATSWDAVHVEVVQDPPVLDLSSFPATAARNSPVVFAPTASQSFGTIVRWAMDFDGDTTQGWDTVVAARTATFARTFPQEGTATVLVSVEDDDGNRAVGSHSLLVRSEGTDVVLRTSPQRQKVSVGDSIRIRFRLNFPDFSSRTLSRIEWSIDDRAPVLRPVDTLETLAPWATPGTHVVRFRVLGPSGATSSDSTLVEVVQDAPVLDLSEFPDTAGLDTRTNLRALAIQEFGSIVSWRIDFDGDTTSGWDRTGVGSLPASIATTFPAIGNPVVLVGVVDDDGNDVVASRVVPVRRGNFGIVQRASSSDTVVSIADTVEIRLSLNFESISQQSRSQLVWRIDDLPSESLSVVESRSLVWPVPGKHVIRFRAVGDFGVTGWDSVVVDVVQGAPRIASIQRIGSAVGKDILFSATVDPAFGSIVLARWDFGADGIWEDTVFDPSQQVAHVFRSAAAVAIRYEVRDDDGNIVDTLFTFGAANAAPSFGAVAFSQSRIGVFQEAILNASFSDPDGAGDLESLSIDWNDDGVWDTVRAIAGLGSYEIRRSWNTPGTRTVRLKIADRSGASAVASTSLEVLSNRPRILSLVEESGRSVARIGDTLWYVATIVDSSTPPDLDSLRWVRDGRPDSVVSLFGKSSVEARIPVRSTIVGNHSLKAVVKDLAGGKDSLSVTWSVAAAAPFVKIRLGDDLLAARDTVRLFLDSLRGGSLGGTIASASWSFKGGSFQAIPSPLAGGSVLLTLPASATRDSLWYVVVRVVQDNGETRTDTARADLLGSFVDKRNGVSYPIVELDGAVWMGRNLNFETTSSGANRSWCPDGRSCAEVGRLYADLAPVTEQITASGAKRLVSVCPDGWRLPGPDDFEALRAAAKLRFPSRSMAQLLRARRGWVAPVSEQKDPFRFGALPTHLDGGEEQAVWLSYTMSNGTQKFDTKLVKSEELLERSGVDAEGVSIRCLRLQEILIDSTWKKQDAVSDSAIPVTRNIKALVPDSIAPVRLRVQFQGRTSETMATPVGHKINVVEVPVPQAIRIGRERVVVELEQSGITVRDTSWFTIRTNFSDEREGSPESYALTRIGNQVWMAKDLNYSSSGFQSGSIEPFSITKHYTLDQLFGGTAPENGPTPGVQGICPEGFHVPSVADWQELLDAVSADGLDPMKALRESNLRWDPALPVATDDYGFRAYPGGFWDGGSQDWFAGGYYWAADATGYSLFHFHNTQTGDWIGFAGPFPASSLAGIAVPVRCVKSP